MFFTVNDGHGNIIYADSVIQDQWITWQAAIKHVVPDGFVVVPKEPTQEMLDAGMGNFDFPLDNGRLSNHDLIFAYSAMIEAQEQSHE